MGLSNYQLVLLDNLIYLETIVEGKRNSVGDLIKDLLYAEGSNVAGTGTIKTDCYNAHNGGESCLMKIDEWIEVLKAIEADSTLCALQVHSVEEDGESGFRAATFVSDATSENVIIFKGTSTASEWMDNGEGGYSIQTENQNLAVTYVDNLDIVNDYSFIVSGHSKGGNLAQYAALFATDTLIDKCLAFDGQGFSQELCESEEYKDAIERNGQNLYMIASNCDYVNVLFKSAVDWSHKMYLESNPVDKNVLEYHKPNIIFAKDSEGHITGLNEATSINSISYFIYDFVKYITENEQDVNNKKIVYDSLVSILAAKGDSNDDMEYWGPGLAKQLLIDLAVTAVAKLFLSRFGVPENVSGGILGVAGKTFDMNTLGELLTQDEYKGEVYELIDSGAIQMLGNYFVEYIDKNTNNMFTLTSMITDFCNPAALPEANEKLIKIIKNGMWKDMLEVFESDSHYSMEDFLAQLDALTNHGTSTMGEGTRGNQYINTKEDGGMIYRGTGGMDSITGKEGDDYLHGGNGRDTLRGGAGDDVLFGGRGNDVLYGEAGNNIYVVERYDGEDTIYNQGTETELNFIFFGQGIVHSNVEYEKAGEDLVIRYNKDYREECVLKVVNFFLPDGDSLPNAVDAVMYTDGRVVSKNDIFALVGYEGEMGKTIMEKIKAMTPEQRQKIFDKYEFLKFEYEFIYKNDITGEPGDNNLQTTIPSDENDNTGESGSGSIGGNMEGSTGGDMEGSTDDSTSGNSDDNSSAAANIVTVNMGNIVNDARKKLLGKNPDTFYQATVTRYVDPIMLDLNGDGIFTTTLEDGTHFDFNGDGFAEKTSWVSRGDGLLVRDVDGNGIIDSGRELFGDQTILKDGSVAVSGFQALSDLDENGDGVIDAKDSSFGELKVWMDFDNNGKSEEDELFTLDQIGILSIDLAHNVINAFDANGNLVKSQGTVSGISNSFTINEYGLNIDHVDTEYRGAEIDTSHLDGEIPELKGCGTLLDLSKAMAVKEELKELVVSYMEEENMTGKCRLAQEILFSWSGAEDLEPGSRGGYMDARALAVLEKVYGEDFIGTSGPNPDSSAAGVLMGLYSELLKDVNNLLLVQTVYKDVLEKIEIVHDKETGSFSCDFTEALELAGSRYPEYYIWHFTQYLLEETIVGDYFDKTYIYEQIKDRDPELAKYVLIDGVYMGEEGSDTLHGSGGNEELYGEAGNDTLYGWGGNDLLVGGAGNDLLCGGDGDDTYFFELGHGQDVIQEGGKGTDRVLFGEGIRPEDLVVTRDAWNLFIINRRTGDSVQFYECYGNANNFIETVEFADGTVWDVEELKNRARYFYGTEGNDVLVGFNSGNVTTGKENYLYGGGGDDIIYGSSGNDELYGEAGNDALYGGGGNDFLVGGTGNDLLCGENGDDTYFFDLGHGQDIIQEAGNGTDRVLFGEGIRPEDLVVTRDAWNLFITNRTTGDSIQFYECYGNANNFIETVEFADGTVWDVEELKDRARYYYGTEGNDTLFGYDSSSAVACGDDRMYGGRGDDTLYGNNGNDELYGEEGNDVLYGGNGDDLLVGGTGNDFLSGGNGNDTYLFALGDGQDVIQEMGNGTDRILFGEGISREDIKFSKEGDSLKISILGNRDSILVQNQFYGENNRVEYIETSDGNVMDYTKLNLMIQAMAAFEDTTGMMWEEAVESGNEEAKDIINQWWTKDTI